MIGWYAAFPSLRFSLGLEDRCSPATWPELSRVRPAIWGTEGAVPSLVSTALLCGLMLIPWELEGQL